MDLAQSQERRRAVSPSKNPSKDSPISRKRASPKAALSTSVSPPPESEKSLQVATMAVTAPSKLNGHIMLFRGGDLDRLQMIYDESAGRLEIAPTMGTCGDFSGPEKGLAQWARQRETVDRHAQRAKHKIKIYATGVLQISIPNTFIKRLSVLYLWFERCSIDP
jgi:hypothetical protein